MHRPYARRRRNARQIASPGIPGLPDALSNGGRATRGHAMADGSRTCAQLDLRPRLMARLLLAGLALACASADARAAISVDSASYRAGTLTVEGHTSKARRTGDARRNLSSALGLESGASQFRIRYRPHHCTMRLQSGMDIFHATAGSFHPCDDVREIVLRPRSSLECRGHRGKHTDAASVEG